MQMRIAVAPKYHLTDIVRFVKSILSLNYYFESGVVWCGVLQLGVSVSDTD